MRLDHKTHAFMAFAAIFGADAAIDSGLVRLQTNDIGVAGYGIDLATQAWHPEPVDNVTRRHHDIDRLTRWEVKVFALKIGPRIGELPLPLAGMGVHAHWRGTGLSRQQAFTQDKGGHQQGDQNGHWQY